MARKKNKRSTKKKRKNSLGEMIPFKYLVFMFISILIVSGSVYGLKYFFLNNDFFKINGIVINNDRGYSLGNEESKLKRLYVGKNIFKINLKSLKNIIGRDLPQLKKVEVRRDLPDVLVVDIFSRVPVAVIETSGGIVVDKDGVVLTIGEGKKNLIKITGLSYFLNVPERGDKIKNTSLEKSLILIMGIKSRMSSYVNDIDYVDISDKNNIVLGVKGVPVKMGIEGYLNKLSTLKQMLRDPKINFKEIKYVDLRFEDPVISPK